MATANLLQTSVSGGTQNALALQGDGVFFPKASTTSRLALTLTTTDKGFVVYDTTDSNIYFWNGTAWESIPGSGDAGANGSVQYNDNGTVSGATNFVWDKVNGRVGIGTATPAYPLQVVGNAFFNADATCKRLFVNDTTGTANAYINSANGSTSNIFLGGQTNYANGAIIYDDASNFLAFRTNGVEAARFNSTGNLVLKSGTAAANGVGVTFPAVQVASSNANCLDDYEEGTFTPTIIGTAPAGTATYSGQNGRYTKVGNIVQFSVDIGYSAGSGGGNLQVAGLPFQNSNNLAVLSTYPINIGLAASYYAVALIGTNATVIDMNQLPTGGGADSTVNYDPAGRIILSGTYTV